MKVTVMRNYILDEIISKAKKQENAVALYLKILPGFPCHDSITIEPKKKWQRKERKKNVSTSFN